MASAKQILLSSLLGGVAGGTGQYLNEKKNQQEYALKRLEASEPPSEIKSLMYVDPTFADKTAEEKKTELLRYRSAGAGVSYDDSGKKRSLNPDTPSTSEKVLAAHEAQVRKEHPNWTPSQVTVEANKRMKNKGGGGSLADALGLTPPAK